MKEIMKYVQELDRFFNHYVAKINNGSSIVFVPQSDRDSAIALITRLNVELRSVSPILFAELTDIKTHLFIAQGPTLPTEQGKSIGISTEERVGQNGTYRVTVYNTDAQQFILDNIDAVIEINNRARADKVEKAELQGQPWTNTHDETLIDLYRKNVPISEIAITLKRTTSGIRGRLKKLGLIEGNVAE